jgi:hypothetical protein
VVGGPFGFAVGSMIGAWQKQQADANKQGARNPREVEECKRLGLMTPVDAQKTKVVRIKGFLSEEEVEIVKGEVAAIQGMHLAGIIERDDKEQLQMIGVWRSTYLHTNGVFREQLPSFYEKCRQAMFLIDKSNWNVLGAVPSERLNFRTVECHEYSAGGRLVEEKHYDAGSFITMDIMLADPGVDFEGGEFATPEADGTITLNDFQKGDAVFFLSHKYHRVQPITKGRRQVIVAEIWDGPEKECAHRCIKAGPCDYTLDRAHMANVGQQLAFLG